MPHRLYKDDQIKLIILYLLNALDDSYDFQTLSEIIIWDGAINYFVFSQCFDELLNTGLIEKIDQENEIKPFYRISEIGKISIQEVEDTLLTFIKERNVKCRMLK